MATVRLDGNAISDWDSFHNACKDTFGFPDFYGRNMNAWVDCLSYLRDDDGMCRFRLKEDETLKIEVLNADALRKQAPDIFNEMASCIAEINERYADYGESPALELILH